jgi:hypothetical protein
MDTDNFLEGLKIVYERIGLNDIMMKHDKIIAEKNKEIENLKKELKSLLDLVYNEVFQCESCSKYYDIASDNNECDRCGDISCQKCCKKCEKCNKIICNICNIINTCVDCDMNLCEYCTKFYYDLYGHSVCQVCYDDSDDMS